MKRDLDYSWYENEDTYVDFKEDNLIFPEHNEYEASPVTTYRIDENGNLVRQ